MALYLGGQRVNVKLGSSDRLIEFYSSTLITNGIRLLTSEDLLVKDSNGLYITLEKESSSS
jgi:hypothetical protein